MQIGHGGAGTHGTGRHTPRFRQDQGIPGPVGAEPVDEQPARGAVDECDEPQHDRRLQAVPHDRRRRHPLLAVCVGLPVPLRGLLQLVDLGFPGGPRIQREARGADHGRPCAELRAGHHVPRRRTAAQHRRAAAARPQDSRTLRPHERHLVLDRLHVGGADARGGEPRQARPAARDRHLRRRPLHQDAARFAAAVPWFSKLHDQERFIPEIYGHERAAGEGDAS